jgi:exodeoxyribonuclease VII small subunit
MSDNNADSAGIAQLSFEEALRALESVVRQLESGEVPLDESISLYEKGEKLRAACQARLDAATARIERSWPRMMALSPPVRWTMPDNFDARAGSAPARNRLTISGEPSG